MSITVLMESFHEPFNFLTLSEEYKFCLTKIGRQILSFAPSLYYVQSPLHELLREYLEILLSSTRPSNMHSHMYSDGLCCGIQGAHQSLGFTVWGTGLPPCRHRHHTAHLDSHYLPFTDHGMDLPYCVILHPMLFNCPTRVLKGSVIKCTIRVCP
jgi:hypothetical protein